MAMQHRVQMVGRRMKHLADAANARKIRCEYLHLRANEMVKVGNPEQAEAYVHRLNLHKSVLMGLMKELEECSAVLRSYDTTA